MTTTEVPETTDAEESVDPKTSKLICLKSVHNIPVYVDPQSGKFLAKFSQGAGVKWFDRPSLVALEQLITAAVYPFSGHVEVGTRPRNIVHEMTFRNLQDGLTGQSHYSQYNAIDHVRPTKVLTGVQRREYRNGTEVFFRTESGSSETMDRSYVKPDPALDGQIRTLAEEYLTALQGWEQRFQTVIDQYEPITPDQVIDELRKQGARVGR